MSKLRLAIDAGHGATTPGKRTLATLGPVVNEWIMNDRVTRHVMDLLNDYEDVEVLRLDDSTGKRDVPLSERTDKANKFRADLLISNHHNAGISGGSGGGTVVYRYPNSSKFTKAMQKSLYDSLVNQTGLKGNRSNPLSEANFHMVRESAMAAVLIEHGFMDSKTDYPIITKDAFSKKAAQGIVDFLVKQYGLKEKPKPIKATAEKGKFFKVQVGAFSVKENAERLLADLKKKGFEGFIKYE